MKIGLYFGTFNPIHNGHLAIANIMANDTDLDKVWLIVSPQNPFKSNDTLLPEYDRFEMVRLSIYDDYNLDASDIEFKLPKPSYTVDTLAYIREKYPDHQFSLIIGEDNLSHFHKWKNYEQILNHHDLLVYPRNNAKETELKDHPKVHMVPAPLLDISATYIRNAIKEGRSVKYLIPNEVIEYIDSKGLYQ